MYTDYKKEELWAKLYCQKQNLINGRNVWLYLVSSSVGNISIVDYEETGLEIKRKIYEEHYEDAEKYFDSICRKILAGKL